MKTKYNSRHEASKALASLLGVKTGPKKCFPSLQVFADALELPRDGSIPGVILEKLFRTPPPHLYDIQDRRP